MSTIKDADKILVFEDGLLIQEGNHRSLLEIKNGLYYNLYYSDNILEEKFSENNEIIETQNNHHLNDDYGSELTKSFENKEECQENISYFQILIWNKNEWVYLVTG